MLLALPGQGHAHSAAALATPLLLMLPFGRYCCPSDGWAVTVVGGADGDQFWRHVLLVAQGC